MLSLLLVQEVEGGLVKTDLAAYVKVPDVGVNAVDVVQKQRAQSPRLALLESMNEAPGGHTASGQRLPTERAECHKSWVHLSNNIEFCPRYFFLLNYFYCSY